MFAHHASALVRDSGARLGLIRKGDLGPSKILLSTWCALRLLGSCYDQSGSRPSIGIFVHHNRIFAGDGFWPRRIAFGVG